MSLPSIPNDSFKETFLHYVWQFQYFDKQQLTTTEGESLTVFSSGFHNKHAGPDFQRSRILLEGVEWHGHVEIHYRSSDWAKHHHHTDPAYNSVVLHVVWEKDSEIHRADNTSPPTLELKGRVNKSLIGQFEQLAKAVSPIPCAPFFTEHETTVDPVVISSMLEKCLIERLEEKSNQILAIYENTRQDWEETAYRWIGKCFGFKVNTETFQKLCEWAPFQLLRKYQHDLLAMEALLYGTAGFLDGDFSDGYPKTLQKEFRYLQGKHALTAFPNVAEWKFLRLRPANFPTLRIGQFASFLHQGKMLYDLIFGSTETGDFMRCLSQDTHPYWHTHFVFDNPSSDKKSKRGLGKDSKENLVINGLLPLRFAFASSHGLDESKMEVLDTFRKIKAEKNSLLSLYDFLAQKQPSAYETQAIHQLHHSYCALKKCLSCRIGHQLIQP